MDELKTQSTKLLNEVEQAITKLDVNSKSTELTKLQQEMSQPDFWADNTHAQSVSRQADTLTKQIEPWQNLKNEVKELTGLIDLNDKSMANELFAKFQELDKQFAAQKKDLNFSGPFDDHNAILSLYAGAGGTDAQDWTQMLLRMYVRWAEKNDFKVTTLQESVGDEAGLKSATITINGLFVYGKLKGEHGVHRLVRLSPFNADNLRQTSFTKVEVLPQINQPEELQLDDKDLRIDVYRSGGHGGQSVNTTDSAVRVTHIPTGISVAIQNERSQLQNKATALTILRSKIAQLQLEQHQENLRELKGPNQSAEWGNQIRSYVLHPYKQVKDLRTKYETSDPDSVLDGNLDALIEAYLEQNLGNG
jgi:peptide chain release factor 2